MTRPIAVQLYSLREEFTADREATIRRLAEIGYDAVEHHRPTDDPAGMRALLDEVGLTVWATHCRIHLDQPSPIVAAARTLGTDRLIIPGGFPHEEFTTTDGVQRVATKINEVAKIVAGEGMRLGYHNHWWEFPSVDGRHAYEQLVELLDPAVFLELDTYWAAVGGADVPALLRRLGDRVHALHVKDGPLIKGEPNTVLGQGRMPISEVIAAAPAGAQLIIEFDHCGTDLITAVTDSHGHLTGLITPGVI